MSRLSGGAIAPGSVLVLRVLYRDVAADTLSVVGVTLFCRGSHPFRVGQKGDSLTPFCVVDLLFCSSERVSA